MQKSDFKNLRIKIVMPGLAMGFTHFEQTIQQHAKLLEAKGVYVPSSKLARKACIDAIQNLDTDMPLSENRTDFLNTLIGDKGNVKCLVILAPKLVGNPTNAFLGGRIFPLTQSRFVELDRIFEGDDVEFFSTIRNPVSLIQALYCNALYLGNRLSIFDYVKNMNVSNLRWSETFEPISEQLQNSRTSLWAFEDYPENLADLFKSLTNQKIKLNKQEIPAPTQNQLSAEGAHKLYEYIRDTDTIPNSDDYIQELAENHPIANFASDDFLFSHDETRDFTYRYEDDCYYISRLENFNLLQK